MLRRALTALLILALAGFYAASLTHAVRAAAEASEPVTVRF